MILQEDELEEKLTAAINQYGRDNIFTISLEGRYQPKEPYDRARLLALGNVADVKDGTMPDYNLVALLDEHKDDMIGMYLEEFLKEPAGTREQKSTLLRLGGTFKCRTEDTVTDREVG